MSSIKFKKNRRKVDRENLVYRASEYTHSFKTFQTTKTHGRGIYDGATTLKEADDDQRNLLVEIINFKKKTKPQDPGKKQKKKIFLKT